MSFLINSLRRIAKGLNHGPHSDRKIHIYAAANRIDALEAENARLREFVAKAEAVFRWYGDLHAAKPDMDKAQRNYDMAGAARAALNEEGK